MKTNNKLLKQSSALVFMALMASASDLPGAGDIAQVNSENYIVHQLEQEDTVLGLHYRLVGCSDKACQIYDQAISSEPAITKVYFYVRACQSYATDFSYPG